MSGVAVPWPPPSRERVLGRLASRDEAARPLKRPTSQPGQALLRASPVCLNLELHGQVQTVLLGAEGSHTLLGCAGADPRLQGGAGELGLATREQRGSGGLRWLVREEAPTETATHALATLAAGRTGTPGSEGSLLATFAATRRRRAARLFRAGLPERRDCIRETFHGCARLARHHNRPERSRPAPRTTGGRCEIQQNSRWRVRKGGTIPCVAGPHEGQEDICRRCESAEVA